MSKVIVTTSWDDGYPLDFKLAKLLIKYNIKGTFYIAPKNREREQLDNDGIKTLVNMGMEIGAHTMTHPDLTNVSPKEAWSEIKTSKKFLEDVTGKKIVSFCYPKGVYNSALIQQVKRAGFKLARTTNTFQTGTTFDQHVLPVTMQFVTYKTGLKLGIHAIRYGNWEGLTNWLLKYRKESHPFKLAKLIFDDISEKGGIFHLWGHSWEIEKYRLWEEAEKVIKLIGGKKEVAYVTNSQLLQYRGN